jgi:hypothetical protein
MLQNSPAPWGEIGSSKFAVASPKLSLLAMVPNDPAEVANYWDKVSRSRDRGGTGEVQLPHPVFIWMNIILRA